MTHQDIFARRETRDPRDLAPACTGTLTYIGWHDVGDADWELFQCDACQQYLHRDSAICTGDTWAGISPNETVMWLEQSNRLIRKRYPR